MFFELYNLAINWAARNGFLLLMDRPSSYLCQGPNMSQYSGW